MHTKRAGRFELPYVLLLMLLAMTCLCFLSQRGAAQSPIEYHYVTNTRPPDPFLSLRSHPTIAMGQRIMTMPNGTMLEVLQRQNDGWWFVRVVPTGQEGWALSRDGMRS